MNYYGRRKVLCKAVVLQEGHTTIIPLGQRAPLHLCNVKQLHVGRVTPQVVAEHVGVVVQVPVVEAQAQLLPE